MSLYPELSVSESFAFPEGAETTTVAARAGSTDLFTPVADGAFPRRTPFNSTTWSPTMKERFHVLV